MRNTSQTGEICCTQLMAALALQGKSIFVPLSDHLRYDFLFEEEGKFFRVQCKNARLRKGCIVVYCHSVDSRSQPGHCIRKKYTGEIDFFGVFCPDNGKCYLIPVEVVEGLACSLRVELPRNGQKTKIRWARDYELTREPSPEMNWCLEEEDSQAPVDVSLWSRGGSNP